MKLPKKGYDFIYKVPPGTFVELPNGTVVKVLRLRDLVVLCTWPDHETHTGIDFMQEVKVIHQKQKGKDKNEVSKLQCTTDGRRKYTKK